MDAVNHPVGHPIPPFTEHAISVSLPTWDACVGYEENDPRIANVMQTGYPRFFIHLSIQRVSHSPGTRYSLLDSSDESWKQQWEARIMGAIAINGAFCPQTVPATTLLCFFVRSYGFTEARSSQCPNHLFAIELTHGFMLFHSLCLIIQRPFTHKYAL